MKKTLLLILLGYCIHTHAQGEAANWFFGRNAGVNFSSGTPVAISDGQIDTLEGCASISNTNGVTYYNEKLNFLHFSLDFQIQENL